MASRARRAGGVAALATAAATRLRAGDFGPGDALRIARDLRRGPVLITLDLTRPLRPDAGGLAALRARRRPTLRQVVDTLTWAAGDDRVVGLHARVGSGLGGLATIQELTAAVQRFVASGKPAIAHAEVFGESANGTPAYTLAAAFAEVHLQPASELALLGVAAEVTFLRGALDKAGIDPQVEHRHEYKNAADVLTEREFTAAHREALEGVVEDWAAQVIRAIATARRIDEASVSSAIDASPLTAREALDRGLVDRLAYLDESIGVLRDRARPDAELTPLTDYHAAALPRQRWRSRHGRQVALVDATGPITVRRPAGPLSGPGVTSDHLCAVLRAAADDDDIAAVLLRVDSPGGSAVASDAIRREILRTRRAGTPVVAWMGDVAGSGGYYIAMGADQIVAQPGTLTGSIGVVSGKAVTTELQRKLGLHTDAVTRGAHARYYSGSTGFSDSERDRLDAQLDHIYDDFTAKVAEDRGLQHAAVHAVAKGRIWTGAQARDHDLVDRLGGYRDALTAVRQALGLAADAELRVRPYPPPRSLLDRARGQGLEDPAERDVAGVLAALQGDPLELLDAVRQRAVPAGPLSMPWVPRLR